MQINLEPGDRVRYLRTGKVGLCQWINWDTSEISIYWGNNAYTVCGLEEVEGLTERILKPISEMTPEEMRLELELLRESRHIAIRDSRKRGEARRKAASKSTPAQPSNPLDFLTPEMQAALKEKLAKAKAKKEDNQNEI